MDTADAHAKISGWQAFDEIESGRIIDASFVANLWRVYINDPNVDERYKNPKEFFERTYISPGLEFVLSNLSRRFSEGEGEPIVVLHTTFGGGKTHTLLAIYHLLRAPQDAAQFPLIRTYAEKVLDAQKRGRAPAVVVFDGAEVDPRHLREKYNANSLCEFIFNTLAKISGSEKCKEVAGKYSDPATSPGAEPLREALFEVENRGFVPVILLDELLEYLDRLGEQDRKFVDAAIRFIDALARAISATTYGVLIVALLESARWERELLEVIQRLGRYAKPENIVGRRDAVHVLKRALLKKIDPQYGESIAKKYWDDLYSRYPEEFPAEVSGSDYKKEIEDSYPFHPQFVKLLYEQLAQLETFQSTRDILRLAARVLHSMLKRGMRGDLVLVSDIDLSDKDIVSELLDRHGYTGLRRAVEADLEVLKSLDAERVSKKLPRLAIPLYSAVLAMSLTGKPVPVDQIKLATARPELDPRSIGTMLENMLEYGKVGHLHRRETVGGKICYIVKERANWRRLARLEAQKVPEEEARQLLKDKLEQATRKWGRRIFQTVYVWPSSPSEVKDSESLKAVFLDPKSLEGAKRIEDLLTFFLRFVEPAGGQHRIYRNTIVFLIPDTKVYANVLESTKFLIACKRLLETKEAYALTEEDIREIENEIGKIEKEISENEPAAMYSKVAFVIDVKNGEFEFKKEDIRGKNPLEAAVTTLREYSKIIENIDKEEVLKMIKEITKFKEKPTLYDLVEIFARDPRKQFLIRARDVIASKVKELVEEGKIILVQENRLVEKAAAIEDNYILLTREEAEKRGLLKPLTPLPTPPESKESERVSPLLPSLIPIQEEQERELEKSLSFGELSYEELLERLRGEEGGLLEIEFSKDRLEDANETIEILKTLIARLEQLESRGYMLRLSLFSEIYDDEETVSLTVNGKVKTTKSCREILDALSKLPSKTLRYNLQVAVLEGHEPLKCSEVSKMLETKLMRMVLSGYKFKVNVKIKP